MTKYLVRGGLYAAALTVGLAGLSVAHAEDSYKIGYITDLSGPLAGSYTPTWEGFELYIKALNDRGGIGGKKVEVVLDDDGLKADRAVSNAKKQAERDNVLGIFGLSLSSTQAPVYTEMGKISLPVVSTFSGILPTLPPAKPFAYSTGVVFEVAGDAIGDLIQSIKKGGKVVGLTFDSVGGRAGIAYNQKSVEKHGGTWDQVLFPVTTTDFTPFAQQVAAKKPDVVVGHYASGQNLGMIPALRRSGYNGPYVVASYGVTEDTVKQAAARAGSGENLYYVTRYATTYDNNKDVAEVAAAQKKYGTSKPLSSMHITGWALGRFAEAALKGCGWPCTREKLDKVMQGLKVELGGLSGGAIEMSATDHYGPSYWRLYAWDPKANKMVAKSDWLKKSAAGYKK